jgi:4-hydroxymandelate oxidase
MHINTIGTFKRKDTKNFAASKYSLEDFFGIHIAINTMNRANSTFELINCYELEHRARAVMPPMAFDYYAGAADDELTHRDNTAAFQRLRLRPRVLRGVAERSSHVTVFGKTFSMPIGIAPMALQKLAHADGELATARAAALHDALMVVSTTATYSLEDIAAAAQELGGTLWFQLYVFKDRAAAKELVRRAESAGYKALVLTADTPFLGNRERDIRNGFHLPPELQAQNYHAVGATTVGATTVPEAQHNEASANALSNHFFANVDASLTWKDVEWLCSITTLPVVVKGIVRGDDAVLAAEHGASGIVVSNHGGRQLDGTVATIDALPEVVDALSRLAVSQDFPIFLDGGVRRGTDVLKALAFGARMVFVGRPVLWGLALGGQSGVEAVLRLLGEEFSSAMGLAGCRNCADISPDLVRIVS